MTAATPVSTTATLDAHTITTRGVGRASGTPDTFTIMIGVSTQGSSAKAALEANNAKSTALLNLLRANGIAAKDLQTRQLSINPTYNDKSATISGYQVDNMVQATSRNIAGAGALIDAAAGVVGNAVRVQQISFSVGEDSALRAQARARAVEQAKAQADQLAKAAGVTLGRIRSIIELTDAGYPISYDMRSAAGAAESAPLQPGQQELSVSVDLVYDIS
ncbi:MAG: SIMPL domain-containing protein [Jatrophihabitantaceae bacterium]